MTGNFFGRGMAASYAAGAKHIRALNRAARKKLLTENAATSPATSPSEALLTVNRPGRSQRAATPSKPLTTLP